MILEESSNSGFLVIRGSVYVTKPATRAKVDVVRMSSRIEDSRFRIEDSIAWIDLRGANISDPGAVVRPSRTENEVVFAYTAVAVRLRIVAHASIAGCEEEGDTLKP